MPPFDHARILLRLKAATQGVEQLEHHGIVPGQVEANAFPHQLPPAGIFRTDLTDAVGLEQCSPPTECYRLVWHQCLRSRHGDDILEEHIDRHPWHRRLPTLCGDIHPPSWIDRGRLRSAEHLREV